MIIGVTGHISMLSGETARDGVRAAFTLGDPNLAANYFICSLLLLRAMQYPRRWLLRWLCCAVLLAAIVLTGSNGGAAVLIATTVLGALFGIARRRGAVPAVIVAATIVFAGVAIVPHVNVAGHRAEGPGEFPVPAGLDRPPGGKHRVSQHDPVGDGAAVSDGRHTARTRQAGTKAAFQAHMYPYVKMAHDDYTAAIVERGALGGLALICLLVIIAARCRRIAARPLRRQYAAIFPRPELLAAAVVGMLISATLYQVLHFRQLWALLGVVAAVDLSGRRDSAGEPVDADAAA